jgi:hypothetical protein
VRFHQAHQTVQATDERLVTGHLREQPTKRFPWGGINRISLRSLPQIHRMRGKMDETVRADRDEGKTRRGVLECMVWAGAGVLWTVSGGVPQSRLIGSAEAATASDGTFTFMQISDSHIGFNHPPNTDTPGTLQAAIKVCQRLGLQDTHQRPFPASSKISQCPPAPVPDVSPCSPSAYSSPRPSPEEHFRQQGYLS